MDNPKTEAQRDQVIAQHARGFYVRHRSARVLRRQLPKEDAIRRRGERAERVAMNALITVIETVDKVGSEPK